MDDIKEKLRIGIKLKLQELQISKNTDTVTQVSEASTQEVDKDTVDEKLPVKICSVCGKNRYFKTKDGEIRMHDHLLDVAKAEVRASEQADLFETSSNMGLILDPAAIPEYIKPIASMKLISGGQSLKAILLSLMGLKEDVALKFTSEGIIYRALDPSHITMTDAIIPSEEFTEYSVNTDFFFTFNAKEVIKGLKKMDKTLDLEIAIDGPDVEFKCGEKSFLKYDLYIPDNIDPLPSVQYTGHFSFQSSEFLNVLESIGEHCKRIKITLTGTGVKFSGESSEGKAGANWENGYFALLDYNLESDEVSSTYDIEILKTMFKNLKTLGRGSRICNEATIDFAQNLPMKISFNLGDRGSRLDFYIAPKKTDY